MAEVKRKKSETFESLLRRFHKKLKQRGRLIQSKKPLISPIVEFTAASTSTVRRPGSGGLMAGTVMNPLLLNDLDQVLVSRAHC